MKLILFGDLPCKKNRIRAGRGGGHYPKEVKETLRNLELQARAQWRTGGGPTAPARNLSFDYRIYVQNPAKDRDGIWTTILDVLKRAGVILDDAIRNHNGTETNRPAEIVADPHEERIEITVTEEPDAHHGSM